jgi:hypothetical protein
MGSHHKVIIACALAAVAALAGCAQPPMVWDRPGTTQTEFSKDQYECVRDTLASGAGADLRAKALDNTQWENTGAAGAIARTITAGNANAEQRAFMQQCMMAHGYTIHR